MEYKEFINTLSDMGYTNNQYKAAGSLFTSWRFFKDGKEIRISYVIDENNRIRQQFLDKEVVYFSIKYTGYAFSDNLELNYTDCIKLIEKKGYTTIKYLRNLRDFKLDKILNT